MTRNLLATSALSALLASAAFAQGLTEEATDQDAAPLALEAEAEPEGEALAEDPAAEPEAPGFAEEPAVEPDAPALVEDPAPADEPLLADDPAAEPALEATGVPVDLADVSPEELVGSDVLDYAGERIATVEEAVLGAGGEVEALVVSFGGFLGFGRSQVEITPVDFEVYRDEDELVIRTALNADDLRDRRQAAE